MTPAFAQIATVALFGAVALLTGQVLAVVLGLPRLKGLDASSAAASALLGFAAWTIGFNLLTLVARLTAARAVLTLALALALLMIAAWRRHRRLFARPRGPVAEWAMLAGAAAVTATLALLPSLRYSAFHADNDTHTYCAMAEFLQRHAIGVPVSWTPRSPPDQIASFYQTSGRRLGIIYPLAIARALGLAPTPLVLYPAVSALGLVWTVCALWWMTRRGLRLGLFVTAATVSGFALAPHSAYWAHHNGFLSQTHASAFLLLGLAALARRRGIGDQTELTLFSAAAAFLYVVYPPFLVLVGAGALVRLVTDLGRARRGGDPMRILRDWCVAAGVIAVLVGLDPAPLLRGLPALARSTTVGSHIPLDPMGFASLALGSGPGAWTGIPYGVAPEVGMLTIGGALLAAIGFATLIRVDVGRGILAALAVLVGLLVRYVFVVPDAWTGERGHTWLVFKVVQYAFPLLLVAQAAGLGRLSRRWPALLAVPLVAAASLAPAHLVWSRELAAAMASMLPGDRPLARLDAVVRNLRSLPAGQLVLLGLPQWVSPLRGEYAALLAYPRPLAVDVEGSASLPVLRHIGAPGIVPLLVESPPFDGGDRTDLGVGFAMLTAVDRPRLVQVTARPAILGDPAGAGTVLPLLHTRTKLLVLATHPGAVDVRLRIEPPGGASTSVVDYQVVAGTAGGVKFRRKVRKAPIRKLRVDRGSVAVVRFEPEPGLNAVVLTVDGPPQGLRDVVVEATPSLRGSKPLVKAGAPPRQ